jgi:hypothetical protein
MGVAFALLWLLPMGYTGVVGYPGRWLQANVRDLYSVTCLFRHRTTERVMFYVQVRYADRRGYYDLDEPEYFPMQPFGHRSRFDRYMARFGHPADADAARRDLARWIADRHGELHPDEPRIVAVRYLWASSPIVADDPPHGHWEKPTRAELGSGLRVLAFYALDEGVGEESGGG